MQEERCATWRKSGTLVSNSSEKIKQILKKILSLHFKSAESSLLEKFQMYSSKWAVVGWFQMYSSKWAVVGCGFICLNLKSECRTLYIQVQDGSTIYQFQVVSGLSRWRQKRKASVWWYCKCLYLVKQLKTQKWLHKIFWAGIIFIFLDISSSWWNVNIWAVVYAASASSSLFAQNFHLTDWL